MPGSAAIAPLHVVVNGMRAVSALSAPLPEGEGRVRESPAIAPLHVVVTGMGAVSALGFGCAALWEAVAAGRDGMRPIRRFPTEGFRVTLAALVPGCDGPEDARFEDGTAEDGLWVRFALAAGREAMAEARLSDVPRHRIGLALGSLRGHRVGAHELAEAVGALLGLDGPRVNVAAACSSSTHAIGLGLDLLAGGACDVVLAGGADAITPDMFAGFHALGLLSTEPCAPFSEPHGTTLGEGAGFLVLETAPHSRARGARPLASLLGYGLSADGWHATSPEPTGAGTARALLSALHDAGCDADAIGYVNAHGTGTVANDDAEWRALSRVLGPRASSVPVSSSKSFLGHAQGAAGALEAIASLLGLARQEVPPTLHFTRPRPLGPADPVAGDRPRPHRYEALLSANAAFGGANAALVLGLPGHAGRARPRRPVALVGAAAVGPHGSTLDELLRALAEPPARSQGASGGEPRGRAQRTPPIALDELVPTADPRGLDPTGLMLTATAARALADARVHPSGALRDRAGLFVGSSLLSPWSARQMEESIRRRGLPRISAGAFTRIVLNAPAGACSQLLSLRGPTTTVAAGAASGLLAMVHAADFLCRHDDADLIVAGGVHELPERPAPDEIEGAACAVLAGAAPLVDGAPIRIAGWGIAGPGRLGDAIEDALGAARDAGDPRTREPDLVAGDLAALAALPRHRALALRALAIDPDARLGRNPSASSALAAACAVALLRRGAATTALVVGEAPRALTCALLLVTP